MEMNEEKVLMRGRQNSNNLSCRDDRIDSVKYWLIVLVIAGHVLAGDFFDNYVCAVIRKWIYIFHMPLFVFISGYFSRKKEIKVFIPDMWKLLEPLLIFHIIAQILTFIAKGSITTDGLLTPWYVLWYLLCLIYWRVLLQIIPNWILDNKQLIVITTLCVSLIAGFLPFGKILSLQRALAFMPFFFLGYCMRNQSLFLPKKYKIWCFVFLIISFALPVFFSNYLGSLMYVNPYYSYVDALKKIFAFCVGIPLSLAFVNICPNKPWFSKQGRLTMQYYIYHAFLIPLFVAIVNRFNLPTSLLAATFYIFVITVGLGVASYLPCFRLFTNPSLLFKNDNTPQPNQEG